MLNLDNSRFMNHSESPNTYEEPVGTVRANRAIRCGEELTCDYRAVDHELGACGRFLRPAKKTISVRDP
jgi:hypothetical protein